MNNHTPDSKITSGSTIVHARFAPTPEDIIQQLTHFAEDQIAEQVADIAVNTTHNQLRTNDSPTALLLLDVVADDILNSRYKHYSSREKLIKPSSATKKAAHALRNFCIVASHAPYKTSASMPDMEAIIKATKTFPELIAFYEKEQTIRKARYVRIHTALQDDECNENMRFPDGDGTLVDFTEWHAPHEAHVHPTQSWSAVRRNPTNQNDPPNDTTVETARPREENHRLDETTIHHIMDTAQTGIVLGTDIHRWDEFLKILHRTGDELNRISREAERTLRMDQKKL